ncbi:MAG: MiaB/RimO family radical SAM methylthiotransferase [candidate division SR1 bacterium]|nr:MiaB/RimO family radical SAM methylthiotransferase [candidate division SR1 bacterium]
MKQQFNFSFINLGCTKNLVDSQYLLGHLFDMGANNPHYAVNYFADPYEKENDFVFLNTCGFIETGRKEMLDTLHELLANGKIVYLLGCGLEYYMGLKGNNGIKGAKDKFLSNHSPLSNLFYLSWNDFENITIKKLMDGYNSTTFGEFNFSKGPRVYTNVEEKFEYLKIAEGCDNRCTFCIIPKIRGKQRSLPIEKVLEEAKHMIKAGIQEIILIAQDTTRYGSDLYGKPVLFELLEKLDKLRGDFKYRLLYLYPDVVTLKQLENLTKLKKFIPYFDIPLQHISSSVLKRMGRFYDEEYIGKFLTSIKELFSVHFIRTNLIIGFPGETEKDFEKLKKFVLKSDFDNIALFEYHDEPFATSSKLSHKVPSGEIRKRFLEMRKLVESLQVIKSKVRKGEQDVGYIMGFTLKSGKATEGNEGVPQGGIKTLTIRPWLHAPEIDSYDEIGREQVLATFDSPTEANIGDRIVYIV